MPRILHRFDIDSKVYFTLLLLFTWIFDAAPELTVLFSASFTLLTRNHVYAPLGRIILAELDSGEIYLYPRISVTILTFSLE